ncbi:MAG: hypothetical protein JXR42_04300 [Gammaproteobacteria bacterium]|nr:hypothetical protein [Gammaproteobacteria bacterium]
MPNNPKEIPTKSPSLDCFLLKITTPSRRIITQSTIFITVIIMVILLLQENHILHYLQVDFTRD